MAGRSGPPERPITVARLVAAHGVQGELRAYPESDYPERLQPGREVYLSGPRPGWYRIAAARPHRAPLWLVRLDGVVGRDAAEALCGSEMQVAAADLPALPEGSYYHYQIVGLAVVTEDGRVLGRVEDIRRTGSADVYVVGPYLIPALREVVREVDLAAGRMVVRPLPGLIEP